MEPKQQKDSLAFVAAPETSLDTAILRPVEDPHQPNGGLAMLAGNMGRAVIKISAVDPVHHQITAPAAVFDNEADVKAAFGKGQLDRDIAVIVRNQGPMANGMPELHSLTPILGTLQDKGHKVMLITDGRMSGASGRVPAAIHVTPEAMSGGGIGRIRDGDKTRSRWMQQRAAYLLMQTLTPERPQQHQLQPAHSGGSFLLICVIMRHRLNRAAGSTCYGDIHDD